MTVFLISATTIESGNSCQVHEKAPGKAMAEAKAEALQRGYFEMELIWVPVYAGRLFVKIWNVFCMIGFSKS